MRDIKFRLWSKKEKKMYGPGSDGNFWADGVCQFRTNSFGSIDQVEVVTWVAIGGTDPDPRLRTLYDFEIELMQYTGLKDINGTEIFEGDIVTPDLHPDKWYWPVKWEENDGGFSPFALTGQHTLRKIDPSEVEIVGNIWENSDLLTTAHATPLFKE